MPAAVLMALLGIGAVAILAAVVGGAPSASSFGARGSTSPVGPALDLSRGFDPRDPAELAKAAGVPRRVYIVAVMLESEAGHQDYRAKVAKAWVAMNDARAESWAGGDPAEVILYDNDRTRRHHFAPQLPGRRYAADKRPSGDSIAAASAVVGGQVSDPTGGARKFADPDSFGKQKGTRTFAEVDAEWRADGLAPRKLDGIEETVFYA